MSRDRSDREQEGPLAVAQSIEGVGHFESPLEEKLPLPLDLSTHRRRCGRTLRKSN